MRNCDSQIQIVPHRPPCPSLFLFLIDTKYIYKKGTIDYDGNVIFHSQWDKDSKERVDWEKFEKRGGSMRGILYLAAGKCGLRLD